MTRARAILLSAVVFATNQATSRADAWVQKRGEGLAIYSINIQSHNTQLKSVNGSLADELRQLNELLQQGIIT